MELKDLLTKENMDKVKDVAAKAAEALPEDVLGKITGGENPFADTPRVPEKPIDPELREDA